MLNMAIYKDWLGQTIFYITLFWVTGLIILDRVGTLFFYFIFSFTEMPFKMHKIICFPENLKKKTLGFTSKFW